MGMSGVRTQLRDGAIRGPERGDREAVAHATGATAERGGVVTLDAVLRELERRRLDAERMHATALVADVLGTVLIDKADHHNRGELR